MSKRDILITNCEKKFVIKCLNEWTRLDGRAFDEFRQLKIEFGKDWGCCYVFLGQTQVLAQVSCEIQEPNSSRPSEGILNINVELSSMAAQNFEAGRQSDLSVQLNRFLEKCLKDSKAIDLESLCIKMHEKVWALRVDVNVINHEGNLLDCASVAALTALAHFKRPDVTCDGEEFIIHSYKERDLLPTVIHHYPVCITYAIFNAGEFILADPTVTEEGIADAYLSIGLNAYKELCGLHLGGKGELTPNVILNTTSKATTRAVTVIEQIKEAIAKDELLRYNPSKKFGSIAYVSITRNGVELKLMETGINIQQEKKHLGLNQRISVDKKVIVDLEACLDQWMSTNKTKQFEKKPELSDIKSLGTGFAALIPEEYQLVDEVSLSSGEDDDDVVFIDKPTEPALEILDSDSEEDSVVVLNADKLTNKNK